MHTSLNYLDQHILDILGHGFKCLDIMGLDILGLDILGIIRQKWHFHDRTLLGLAVFRVAFGHLYESC